MMHLLNLTFRRSGDSSPQASATSQPAPTFGFGFDGIFIYKAKAIIHGVFFSVAGAAQDNYFDEESEDNESDEEGDIDEDMVDIDRCEICIFLCVVRNLLHRKIKFC